MRRLALLGLLLPHRPRGTGRGRVRRGKICALLRALFSPLSMQTNLLPELDDSHDDLLPVGTRVGASLARVAAAAGPPSCLPPPSPPRPPAAQVFPTTLRLRAEFYHVLLFMAVTAPVLLVVAVTVEDSGGAGIVALLTLILMSATTPPPRSRRDPAHTGGLVRPNRRAVP